jgi:hypothetical protein
MQIELIVALVSGAIAIASAGLAIIGQLRVARLSGEFEASRLTEEREYQRMSTIARYREPLAHACYDLQSRLYNILQMGLISTYYVNGDERERGYVVNNTTFLFAQYFAWTEIVRQDIQFIDLGHDSETRQLRELQDRIYSLLQTDRHASPLRVFAGEQRAIGERLLVERENRTGCMGYGAFLDRLPNGADSIVDSVRRDIAGLATTLPTARDRLVSLQHALIDLLAFLDPQFIRFPKERREKVASISPALT